MALQPPRSGAEARVHEQRLKAAVSAALPRDSDHPVEGLCGQHVVFDDVTIEGTFPDSALVVHVRDPARPACRFVVSWPVWNVADRSRRPDGMIHASLPFPAEQAGPILAERTEQFVTVGLPAECAESAVTWVTTRSRVLDPAYFAARVLAAFRQRAPQQVTDTHFGGRLSRCWVRQVHVEGEYPHQWLVVLIEAEHRAECTFGFRWPLWNGEGRPDHEEDWPTPEEQAWIAMVHLEEDLEAADYGLPTDCAHGQITWFR